LAIYRSAVGLLIGTTPKQRDILISMQIPRTYVVGEQNINEIPMDELQGLSFKVFIVPQSGHAMMNYNPLDFKDLLLKAIKMDF